jgi:hypothetical protein
MASGHHAAPAATIASIATGCGLLGARTVLVLEPIVSEPPGERRQGDAPRIRWPIAGSGQLVCPLADPIWEGRRRDDLVDEPPLLRTLAAHALGRRAEDIREIAPHLALVGQPRQPARAGQDAEQRDLG